MASDWRQNPLWPDRTTVGGWLATADNGTLRLRYGGVRDLVLGVEVVLPDGNVIKAGGKVVKNVAGYESSSPSWSLAH